MALFRWMQLVGLCVLAGSAGMGSFVGAQTLRPDEDLGPIQQLPATRVQAATEFQPAWRSPKAARPPAAGAPKSNPLAPPQIDLPDGTDAPPYEPSVLKAATQRKGFGGARSADAEPTPPGDRRLLRSKAGKGSDVGKTGEPPVNVEIPGLDSLPILEAPTKAESLGDTPEPTPPRQPLFSRLRSTPPPAASESPASRPTRTGWGLFRRQPVSR